MDARMQKHRTIRWLGRLFVVFSVVMSSGANAVTESASPVRLWCNPYAPPDVSCIYPTDSAAAQAEAASYNSLNAGLGYTDVIYGCDGQGLCYYITYDWNGKMAASGPLYIGSSFPNCPIPTINPAVRYAYNPNSGMCERPVQETYQLALTPGKATIEPGQSYKFTATVTKTPGGGTPSISVPVSVEVEVEPTSGGHDHGEQYAKRDRGTVSPNRGTNTFQITFTATGVSGTHTITATCDMCTNGPQKAKVDVKVKESDAPGWGSLSASPSDYELIGGEEGKNHTDNHYLTESAQKNLLAIVRRYNKAYPTGPVLYLNDASLVWGGKFDISGKWSGGHDGHLRGREIDIRANQLPTAIPYMRFNNFKKFAGKNGAFASVHCSFPKALAWACAADTGPNRHFHVYLGK